MRKIFNSLFFSKGAAIIFAVLAAVTVLFNYAFRFGYVYIDVALFGGFSMALFIVMLLNAVSLTVLLALRLKNPKLTDKKSFKTVSVILELLQIVFALVVVINFIVSGSESVPVALKLCKQILPLWFTVFALVWALFIIPCFKSETLKKCIAGVTAAVLLFTVYSSLFPVTAYKFTSSPVVFDNGTDYSVVFSTNDKGTAYLEYNKNGETTRVYDENNGRKVGNSIIHTVRVPYDALSNSTYKVFSTRVIDELSYGGRVGKTIVSEEVKFSDTFGDNVNVLTVSDWHTQNKKALQAVSKLPDYSAVILLGDGVPGLMFPEEVANYIISFASDLTGGKMPVIFARGNHETRGREAANLSKYLGMDKFYFTTKIGNYNFVVLDSGEDKEDSHPEYGSMVNYEQYRRDMVNWLESQDDSENAKTIALSHAEDICIEEDLSERALKKLNSMNVSLLVSGHEHISEFKQGKFFPIFVDGGVGAGANGGMVVSELCISNENIKVLSVDENGEKVIDETVLWK